MEDTESPEIWEHGSWDSGPFWIKEYPQAIRWWRNRHIRQALLLAADAVIITMSFIIAYWLRFDIIQGGPSDDHSPQWWMLSILVSIRWICGWFAGQYNWSFRHSSLAEGVHLGFGIVAGTLIFAFLGHVLRLYPPPPRSIYILESLLTFVGIATLRFFPKYVYLLYCKYYNVDGDSGVARKRTLIYGAGGNAELLVRELVRTRGHGFELVGFVDDSPNTWKTLIHGIRVLGGTRDMAEILTRRRVEYILVAIPNFKGEPLRRLVDLCGERQIKFKIIPSYPSVLEGKSIAQGLKDIEPESLLDREEVKFDSQRMDALLAGKLAMVTGAAGSIGSELCRKLAAHGVRGLILLDINENGLYHLHGELRKNHPFVELLLTVGSIRDRARLDEIMGQFHPEIVFHAAAHKHVPLMEWSPAEAIKNNVLGTWELASAAKRFGVERFILISSDKAVASTNIMGASKRLAERIVRNLGHDTPGVFAAVRFGNVLGSSGSLLEIIRRQIAEGGPVTVTHPEMTRFFMTIPEATDLVLQAASLNDGDTYVLDMGKPINIDKLVRQVVALSGLTPDRDIEIRYTGPRPGEKMHEELFAVGEDTHPSSAPRISVALESDWDFDVDEMLAHANEAAKLNNPEVVKAFFRRWVEDYNPAN